MEETDISSSAPIGFFLSGAIWTDGTECKEGSIGKCKKK
jgi:hypothetical protein